MEQRLRFRVAYHGAGFHGWQIQTNARSVEGVLTAAVSRLNGRHTKVWGASRTDAGVHATGQVAAFDATGRHDPATIARALSAVLPDDVSIAPPEPVDASFHPRHSARGKTYQYHVWSGLARSPFLADRTLHVRAPLDLDAMRAAAKHLVGEHDFASFQAAGCDALGTVRTLWSVDVHAIAESLVRVDVSGTAFLKYMVRNLVGTLLEVAVGRREAAWIPAVIAARDRRAAGPTAAPHGLSLVEVRYPDHPWLQPRAIASIVGPAC